MSGETFWTLLHRVPNLKDRGVIRCSVESEPQTGVQLCVDFFLSRVSSSSPLQHSLLIRNHGR